MILDKIENAVLYSAMSENLKKGFDFLLNTDLQKLATGKYEIDGTNVFVMISENESKLPQDCRPEAHRAYADIQYIISGREAMGYASLNGQTVASEFDPEKDIVFFSCETLQLNLEPGMFAVFFPQDIHQPCMQVDGPEKVKKAVVKVKI